MATFTSICFLNVVVVIVALLYLLLTPSVELEEDDSPGLKIWDANMVTLRDAPDMPQIYIGSFSAALDLSTLRKLNVRYILSVGRRFSRIRELPETAHTIVFAKDSSSANLFANMGQVADIMHKRMQYLKGKKAAVLVHCMQGKSRSVTMLAAYLIKYHGFTDKQAVEWIRKSRKIAKPNSGFLRQLEFYYASQNAALVHADWHAFADTLSRPSFLTHDYVPASWQTDSALRDTTSSSLDNEPIDRFFDFAFAFFYTYLHETRLGDLLRTTKRSFMNEN